MTVAYVGTSCLVAIAFGEPGAKAIARQMDAAQELVSSNLLEAELRSVFSGERAELPAEPSVLTYTTESAFERVTPRLSVARRRCLARTQRLRLKN